MQALSILFKRLFELLMRPVRFIAHRTWLFLRSIRFRLTAWFVIILGFVLLAFSSFVYSRQARFKSCGSGKVAGIYPPSSSSL